MKAKPILMTDAMVVATLDGLKTQTRRIVKDVDKVRAFRNPGEETGFCPYGKRGTYLYVRECWALDRLTDRVVYRATKPGISMVKRWKPSIHMRREHSRITLKITDIRLERVRDISEEDARAEGIRFLERDKYHSQDFCGVDRENYDIYGPNAYTSFMRLWDSINGKPRKNGVDISWYANPYVWAITFKPIFKHIDEVVADEAD